MAKGKQQLALRENKLAATSYVYRPMLRMLWMMPAENCPEHLFSCNK